MKQEFITLNGKVVAEDGFFRIINHKTARNSESYFIGFNLLFLMYVIDSKSKAWPLAFAALIVLGVYACILLIEALFIRSWKNRILYSRIKSFKLTPDAWGLETTVVVHLKNGRQKKMVFRNREHQHEAFVELLTKSSLGAALT